MSRELAFQSELIERPDLVHVILAHPEIFQSAPEKAGARVDSL